LFVAHLHSIEWRLSYSGLTRQITAAAATPKTNTPRAACVVIGYFSKSNASPVIGSSDAHCVCDEGIDDANTCPFGVESDLDSFLPSVSLSLSEFGEWTFDEWLECMPERLTAVLLSVRSPEPSVLG
jgi:hypothetical protein